MIALHDLPKSFKDSIKTLRQLGFQYVWVDSLCIIQDDLDDKEREIYQMPNIYKNSELTLCASSAESCDQGFLQPRPDYSENQLQLTMPNNKIGTIYFDRVKWRFPPIGEPLNSRAWALQERLLSPRLLEYGWRTSRWSCLCSESYSGYQLIPISTGTHEDSLTTLNYNLYRFLNPSGGRSIAKRREDLLICWSRIVDQYTSRSLTLPDDRLAAIGGVAAELQERTGVPYLAGLWNYEELPTMLLWKVDSPLYKLQSRPLKTSRAPSWSWAAVDGAVTIFRNHKIMESFRVLNTEVSGGFGISARGSLTIEGPVQEGLWWYEGWNFTEHLVAPDTIALIRHDCELSIWPDCHGEFFEFLDNRISLKSLKLTFVAIGRANWDQDIIRGLVLLRDDGKYKRVGRFQVRDKDRFSVADWSVEVLCIV